MAEERGDEMAGENLGFGFVPGEWNELIGEDIKYKVLTPGHGPIAEVQMMLRCKYVGRLRSTGQIFEVAEDTGYRIGESDTTPALELGLRHMRKGEKGMVHAEAKYGFGPPGRPVVAPGAEVAVPPDAALEYEIEVIDILPPFNPKDAPLEARLGETELKKRHGNGFFHHKDYTRAIRCYQAGLKALDAESVDGEEEEEEAYEAMVKMFCDVSNNLAAALIKLERWKDAKEVCVKVIEVDKDNVKALYRGGVAALRQDNFLEAELALKEAAKLAPKDKLIHAAVQELYRNRTQYIEKEKVMMKKMGGFLLTPAATGIEDKEGKEPIDTEEMDENAAQAHNEQIKRKDISDTMSEAKRDHSKVEAVDAVVREEEEENQSQTTAEITDDAAPLEQENRPINPWLAWYISHYDWFVTAAFIILPLLFLWGDIKSSWARRLSEVGKGGGQVGSAGEL